MLYNAQFQVLGQSCQQYCKSASFTLLCAVSASSSDGTLLCDVVHFLAEQLKFFLDSFQGLVYLSTEFQAHIPFVGGVEWLRSGLEVQLCQTLCQLAGGPVRFGEGGQARGESLRGGGKWWHCCSAYADRKVGLGRAVL